MKDVLSRFNITQYIIAVGIYNSTKLAKESSTKCLHKGNFIGYFFWYLQNNEFSDSLPNVNIFFNFITTEWSSIFVGNYLATALRSVRK